MQGPVLLIGLLAGVPPHVDEQRLFLEEPGLALVAREILGARVRFDVPLEVAGRGEGAAAVAAQEGPLARVLPAVIQQVAPGPEGHSTLAALKNLVLVLFSVGRAVSRTLDGQG